MNAVFWVLIQTSTLRHTVTYLNWTHLSPCGCFKNSLISLLVQFLISLPRLLLSKCNIYLYKPAFCLVHARSRTLFNDTYLHTDLNKFIRVFTRVSSQFVSPSLQHWDRSATVIGRCFLLLKLLIRVHVDVHSCINTWNNLHVTMHNTRSASVQQALQPPAY